MGPRADLQRCGKSLHHRDSIPGSSCPSDSPYRPGKEQIQLSLSRISAHRSWFSHSNSRRSAQCKRRLPLCTRGSAAPRRVASRTPLRLGRRQQSEEHLQRINTLARNYIYIYNCRTAQLTSRRCILNIYSTNILTEYFKHAAHSPFFFSSSCLLFHNAMFWFL